MICWGVDMYEGPLTMAAEEEIYSEGEDWGDGMQRWVNR